MLQALFWLFAPLSSVDAWSPSNGYAPGTIRCPHSPLIRPATGLHPEEIACTSDRRQLTRTALANWVSRTSLDFDVETLVLDSNVTIGLAFSGGGYRAMLVGAGELSALDSRSPGSTDNGHIGGLLQASAYMTALSGGSWLMASVYMNNFTTVDALLSNRKLWDFSGFIVNKGSEDSLIQGLILDPVAKQQAGFTVSLTDFWGRILSKQIIDLPNGGPALEWSDLANWSWFQNRQAPYPIFLVTDRMPIQNLASHNAAIYEVSPYELGTFDPPVYAFTPLQYLGTKVSNGIPQPPSQSEAPTCYSGLDNAGFLFGTSSSVFDELLYNLLNSDEGNQVGLPADSQNVFAALRGLLNPIIKTTTADVGVFSPNPFKGYVPPPSSQVLWSSGWESGGKTVDTISRADQLYLVDGGENGQVIPTQPLLHHDRQVDVMMVFDNDRDTSMGWPTGASVVAAYQRQFVVQSDTTSPVAFPYVPDSKSFVNLGLTSRPTFFGCYAQNTTSLSSIPPPLMVYMANYPYSAYTNTSTAKMTYTPAEAYALINNGYNLATQLNGTIDADWHNCLTCAVVQRELERRGYSPSPQCQACFSKYCWNGQTQPTDPSKSSYYSPSIVYQAGDLHR